MEALTDRAMSKLLLSHARFLVFLAGLLASVTMQAKAVKSEFSSMVAAGKVNGDIYQNSILGITLSAPKASWDVRGPVRAESRGGRLVDASYNSGEPERGPQENYTLGLIVESQENYPKGTTLDQYARSLRQRVENENLKIYREGYALTVQQVPFVGTVFRFYESPKFGYYRGLYSTLLNGYFVTIEVQCGEEERLEKRLSFALQIIPKPKR
jgi:hypothetical protein